MPDRCTYCHAADDFITRADGARVCQTCRSTSGIIQRVRPAIDVSLGIAGLLAGVVLGVLLRVRSAR